MATRVLNRRARRVAVDLASQPLEVVAIAKPATVPLSRVRKKRKTLPPTLFAHWAVCDAGMKHIAVFEYRERKEAEAKLAKLLIDKAGGYVLQLVKAPLNASKPLKH